MFSEPWEFGNSYHIQMDMIERTMVIHSTFNGLFTRQSEGARKGPAILFVHGLGESGLCFESLIRSEIFDPFQLVVPDLYGYGRSLWLKKPRAFAGHISDLTVLLDRLEVDSCIIVGHSMGGVLATFLARELQDRAKALVNIEGNISLGDCVFSHQTTKRPISDFLERGFSEFLDEVYRQGLDDNALRGYSTSLRFSDPRTFYFNAKELVETTLRENLARHMVELDIPTIYIAGIPRGVCQESLEILEKNAVNLGVIEESGHWPFIDHEREFLATLQGFLQELS